MSNRNMAKKIVSSVITLAPLVIASSVGKPQEKEVCCLGGKTLISLCLQKKNRNPAHLNGSSSGACEIIFLWCLLAPFLAAHAQCSCPDFTSCNSLPVKVAKLFIRSQLSLLFFQRETMLSNVQQKRTVKTIATQTHDDGSNFLDHGDDDYDSTLDASGSDAESFTSTDGRKRIRRAANKIRIFHEAADYSHVRSKVR